MFCTNCGAKLPEGSKFCMQCGAKLAPAEEPAPSTNDWNEPLETVVEQEPVESRRPAISFDWSNVKEESHKREVPEVHSPWGTTGLSEKELFAEISTPSDDHSRTMSFIDILKKERDAKAQAAEEEARPVTEREEPEADYTAFQEAPSFYVPPMYDDLEGTTVTPFDNLEPEVDEAEETLEVEELEVPFEVPEIKIEEEEEKYHTASFDSPDLSATEDYTELEASLAAILEAGAGKTVAEDEPVDLFGDIEDEDESVEDLYLNVEEEPSLEMTEAEDAVEEVQTEELDIEEAPVFEEPTVDFEEGYSSFIEEPIEIESEEDLDEEAISELEKLYISEDDLEAEEPETVVEAVEEVVEEPATEAEAVESEIEALKRRLAELMGEPEEVVDIAKPEPSVEELIEETYYEEPSTDEYLKDEVEFVEEATKETVEEAAEEVNLVEKLEDEFEVELSDEEPEEEDEVVEVIAEEPVSEDTDAVSLEELEKDLFGDAEISEEPEATKKIDKFYTLYKKNEEFQKLLDEEYNKLQGEDKVPHVDDFVPVEVIKDEPVADDFEVLEFKESEEVVADTVEETVEPVVAAVAEPVKEVASSAKEDAMAAKKAEKEAAKAAKAAAKAAKKAEKAEQADDEEAGGSALTVIAVIIAALLVVLLAVILVLNFAPDSGIAMKIDAVIETITSYFSVADSFNGHFLL